MGAAEVDLAHGSAQGDLDRGLELARDLVRADEVTSRSARDERELDVQAGDPVGDLVHGSVPADCDEELGAAIDGLAREFTQVARPLREKGVALEPERCGGMGELRPAPAGAAVLGGGVDEEDGLANGR
jgi:hypothetical protein